MYSDKVLFEDKIIFKKEDGLEITGNVMITLTYNFIKNRGIRLFDKFSFNYNNIIYHALDKEKCFVMLQISLDNVENYKELNLEGYDKFFLYCENKEKGKLI